MSWQRRTSRVPRLACPCRIDLLDQILLIILQIDQWMRKRVFESTLCRSVLDGPIHLHYISVLWPYVFTLIISCIAVVSNEIWDIQLGSYSSSYKNCQTGGSLCLIRFGKLWGLSHGYFTNLKFAEGFEDVLSWFGSDFDSFRCIMHIWTYNA